MTVAAPNSYQPLKNATIPSRTVAHVAAEYAEEAEHARTLHPAVAEATRLSGFARHFTPVRWGGSGGSFTEALEAVATVGEGCAAAGWWASLQAKHARLAALLPTEAQRDLWADGPDVSIAAAVGESGGRAVATPEGWSLTGRWRYASGIDHAHWVLLAAESEESGGPRPSVFLVPRADVRIESQWSGAGLRGSGTHAITVSGARVPRHRAVGREVMIAGAGNGCGDPCHRVPVALVASLLFAAPCLGAARSALRAWVAQAGGGAAVARSGARGCEALARSAAEIDAAGLLLARAAARADAQECDRLAVATNQRDCAVAVDILVGAVERLYRASGVAGQREGGLLERAWRDVHAIAAHAMLRLDAASAAYAEAVGAETIGVETIGVETVGVETVG